MSGLMLLSKLTIYSGPILVASCWNCSLFGIGVSSLRHAPHTPGMWNRCEYRGTRKGRGLVTCGYASVIKHGELGNPQPKWRFTAVRWEKKMGDSPLPGLTLGGYIWWDRFFHCWVADATAWCWTCTHFRAEVAKCQGLMPGDLWDKMNISIRVVALFFCRFAVQHRSIFLCNFGALKNVDASPRWTWFKNVKKTSNHFERSGADQVSLSQHSRNPTGWLADSLFSLWLFMMQFAAQKFS